MKRHLFGYKTTVISAVSMAALILSFEIPVRAATSDVPENRQVTETIRQVTLANPSGNQSPGINLSNLTGKLNFSALGNVGNFLGDINSFLQGELFGEITQRVQQVLGSVQIPDVGEVVNQLMKGSLPADFSTAIQVENNVPDSYAIREDAAKMSERVAAIHAAQTHTLSKTAQENSQQVLEYSITETNSSALLAQDSQSSDTSQQILQNISNQLKNQAAIADLQMKEANQARQDRALQLTLSAQAARELNAANIRERQSAIASGNAATAQGALLTMPGGAVLGGE